MALALGVNMVQWAWIASLEDARREEEANRIRLKEREEAFYGEEEKKERQEEIKRQSALLEQELLEYDRKRELTKEIGRLAARLGRNQEEEEKKGAGHRADGTAHRAA